VRYHISKIIQQIDLPAMAGARADNSAENILILHRAPLAAVPLRLVLPVVYVDRDATPSSSLSRKTSSIFFGLKYGRKRAATLPRLKREAAVG
jgi:hypothetical protein